jgi:hypothetical protein
VAALCSKDTAVTTAALATATRLIDVVRQQAKDGSLLPIIESLSKLTPFLDDAAWVECNNGTYHTINRRVGLPAPVRRRINKGVAATLDLTAQADEVTTSIADKAIVDSKLIKLNGPEYRARAVAGHMMGMVQQAETDLLVGSIASDADGIDGIETRLNATTNTPGGNQIKLVDAAPSGSDQASILLIGWAAHGVHCIYPKGLPGGINHRDFGENPTYGSDGTNTYPAFMDWFEWDYGLAVEDFRYCARAANIDTSAISYTVRNVITAMIALAHRCLVDDASARWAFYMPRFLAEYLQQQAINAVSTSTLKIEEIAGRKVTTVMGFPVRVADEMTITESIVA